MSSIDSRIVQMQFQNSQFEKGVKESLKSVEELEKALKFKDAEKGLESLQKAGNSFSLAHMASGIDGIASKFSVLGVIGKRVLEDLTDSAYRFGVRFVKSVSVDQISSGFSKYADKTKSVQTIVNATGLTIDEVDKQLSKLALFTDETSYNFTDMVSNIGKFTAMNVPLDKSVTAMEGIATWAAVSGQGINEASRAMYNLSQAMGAGAVKLIDWKSIENANMGTAEFKQTAIDTAIAMGILKEGGKTAKGTAVNLQNFSQTLQQGWFTSDVLLKTLEKYGSYADKVLQKMEEDGITAAQAMEKLSDEGMELGAKAFRAAQEAKTFIEAIDSVKDAVSTKWMGTFENIFGNYEEAKVIWTDLANGLYEVFAASGDARNELLAMWKELGGREDLIEGVYGAFSALYSIIVAVKSAISDIIPPVTVEQLLNFSKTVKEIGTNLKETFGIKTSETTTIHNIGEDLKNAKIGDQTEEVKRLNDRLVELGYLKEEYAKSGNFTVFTQAAIKQFQKDQKLLISGTVDDGTFEALKKASGKALEAFDKELKNGASGDGVKEMQQKLIDLGYLKDEFGADGKFGKNTEAALKAYQKAMGLEPTGIFDEKTFKKLNGASAWHDFYIKNIEENTEFSGTLEKLQKIVRGVAAAFSIVWKVLGFVGRVIGHVVTLAMPLINAILDIGGAVSDAIVSFNDWLDESGKIEEWFTSAKEFFAPFGDWVKEAADNLLVFFGIGDKSKKNSKDMMTFSKLWGNIKASIEKTGAFKKITTAFNKLGDSFKKIKPKIDAYWKSFKQAVGEKFNSFIDSLPGAIATVTDAIASFISGGINLLTPWIESIPGAIDKIKAFFSALTDEGDAKTGRKAGPLGFIKNKLKDVIDFLFGEGDPTKGKNAGLFRRIGKLLAGDIDGFLEGLNEEDRQKALENIEKINNFLDNLKSSVDLFFQAIAFFFTGNEEIISGEGNANKLGEDTIARIQEFRTNISNVIDAIGYLFTGKLSEGSKISEDTKQKVESLRDTFKKISDTLKLLFTGEVGEDTKLSKGTIDFINRAREHLFDLIDAIKLLATGEISEGTTLSQETQDKILNLRESVGKFIDIVSLLFTGDVSGIDTKLSEQTIQTIKDIRDVVTSIVTSIKEFFFGSDSNPEGVEKTTESLESYITPLEGFAVSAGEVSDSVDDVSEALTVFGQKGNIFGKIRVAAKWFKKVYDVLVTLFTGVAPEDTDLKTETVDTIIDLRNKIIPIIDNVKAVINIIRSKVKEFYDAASTLFTGVAPEGTTLDSDSINGIIEFRDKIIPIIDKVKSVFEGIKSKFNEYFGDFDFSSWDSIKESAKRTWDRIKEDISKIWDNIVSSLQPIIDKIKGYVQPIIDKAKAILEPIWNKIKDIFSGFDFSSWDSIKGSAKKSWNKLKSTIKEIWETIEEVFEEIGKWAKYIIRWSIYLAPLALIVFIFIRIKQRINRVKKTLDAVTGGFGNLAKGFRDSKKKIQPLALSVLEFAAAIGLVVGALYSLSKMKSGDFWKGFAYLNLLVGVLAGLIAIAGVLSRKDDGKKLEAAGKAIFQIAGAIAILVASVFILSKFDANTFWGGLGKLAVMMGLLVGFVAAVNWVGKNNVETKGILKVAGAIAILTLIVGLLGKFKAGTMIKGLVGLAVIMGLLVGFIASVNWLGKNQVQTKGLLSVAFAIGIMALIVGLLGKFKIGTLIQGLLGLTAISIILVGTALALSAANRIGKGVKPKGIIGIAVAIGLLAVIFVGLAIALQRINAGVFVKTLIAFGGIVAALIVTATIVSKAKIDSKNMFSLLPMVLAIGLLAAVFIGMAYYIKDINTATYLKALLAFGGIVAALIVMSVIISKTKVNVGSALALIPLVLAFALLAAAFVGMAYMLQDIDTAAFIKTIIGFGAVLGALIAITVVSKKATDLKGALSILVMAAALAGLMYVFSLSLQKIKNVNFKVILSFALGLSALMLAMAVVGKIAGANPLMSFVGIIAVFAGLAVVIGAIMGLLSIPEVEQFLSSGAEKFGGLIGKFVGAFRAASLTTFANDMGGFAKGFNGYSKEMDKVEIADNLSEKTDAAIAIAQSLSDFSRGLPINYKLGTLAKWFVNDSPLTTFGADIVGFAEYFNNYSTFMSGIEISEDDLTQKTTTAVNIGTSLSNFCKDLGTVYKINTNGPLGWFVSGSPLTNFSEDMSGFAKGFNDFATFMSGIEINDEDLTQKTSTAVSIGTSLSNFCKDLGTVYKINTNGPLGWFVSGSPLTNFSGDMGGFAKGFNDFAKFMSGIEIAEGIDGKTETMVSIAKGLADLSTSLPGSYTINPDGPLGWFVSGSPLENLAEDMSKFAIRFNAFGLLVNGITADEVTEDKVKAMTSIAKGMADLSTSLPGSYTINPDGPLGWFVSGSPLENLAEDMSKFAIRFNAFGLLVNGITADEVTEDKVKAMTSIAKGMADLSTSLPGSYTINPDGPLGWFVSGSPLENLAEDMSKFAEKFNSFGRFMTGINVIDDGSVESKSKTIVAIANVFKDLAVELPGTYSAGKLKQWFSSGSPLETFANDMQGFATKFDAFAKEMKKMNDPGEIEDKKEFTIKVASAFSDLSKNLPSAYNSSKMSKFFGKGSPLSNFGDDMINFADRFNNFTKEIQKVDDPSASEGKVTFAIQIASDMADLISGIDSLNIETKEGGFLSLFSSTDTKHDTVFDALGTMADSMKTAAGSLHHISLGTFGADLETAINAVQKMAEFLNFLGDDEHLGNIEYAIGANFDETISDLSYLITTFVQDINDKLNDPNNNVDTTTIANIIKGIADLFTLVNDINNGTNTGTQLNAELIVTNITTFSENIVSACEKAVEDITTAYEELSNAIYKEKEPETPQTPNNTPSTEQTPQVKPEDVDVSGLKTAGQNGAEAFGEGMTSVDLSSDTNSVVGKAVAAANSGTSDFVTVGKNFTEGLAQGVEDGTAISSLTSAITRVVQKAIEAAQQASDSHSPSKEFAKIGRFFSLGMAVGVDETGGDAAKSTENVVKTMLSTAKGSMATLSQLLAEDIDDTPVIRPVVDLSNARSAAATIGDMFNGSRSFGVETRELANKASDANQARLNARNNQNGSTNSGSSKNTNISTGVNITGNNFYVRDETDIYTLGSEIASLSKQQQRSYGATV